MGKSFGITKTLRKLRRLYQPGAVILTYHQVTEIESDPFHMVVSPDQFDRQMAHLKKHYHLMRLIHLTEALKRDELPHHAVAVTFDDGYHDNLTQALPILQRYDIPATISIITSQIEQGPYEFWWDKLERILLCTEELPVRLEVNSGSRKFIWITNTVKQKHQCFHAIHRMMLTQKQEERNELLNQLFSWAGVSREDLKAKPFLSKDELKKIAEHPLIDIGAHTVTHPFLSIMDEEGQEREIRQSKQFLEEILGRSIDVFVYPFGSFNAKTLEIVENAGYGLGCSTLHGSVDTKDNLFYLRRCKVMDWNLQVFKNYLKRFFKS